MAFWDCTCRLQVAVQLGQSRMHVICTAVHMNPAENEAVRIVIVQFNLLMARNGVEGPLVA